MRYRMIGIDMDGTLLDRRGRVSEENRAAIAQAQAAGVVVVPCTGRAWSEASPLLRDVSGLDRGVFVGGAAVSEIATGRSLDLAVFEPHVAMELVDALFHLPEAVLVFQDAALAGHDYLVTGRGELSANTRWWFEFTKATPVFKATVTQEDLRHALRIGIVSDTGRMEAVTRDMRERFASRVVMQSFAAVQMPGTTGAMHVLEIFASGVDKWRGLRWLADQMGIEAEAVAAIGDEINDVAMIQAAGCGIAMGNAVPAVKAVADHVTLDCAEAGVAHAIRKLLSGAWG
ncbi:MAG: HAD-IIB family hydrolase [Planctomycetota bacterium]|nr:HAD-IIB family hydrolase [Planctomycetota bacterium]